MLGVMGGGGGGGGRLVPWKEGMPGGGVPLRYWPVGKAGMVLGNRP